MVKSSSSSWRAGQGASCARNGRGGCGEDAARRRLERDSVQAGLWTSVCLASLGGECTAPLQRATCTAERWVCTIELLSYSNYTAHSRETSSGLIRGIHESHWKTIHAHVQVAISRGEAQVGSEMHRPRPLPNTLGCEHCATPSDMPTCPEGNCQLVLFPYFFLLVPHVFILFHIFPYIFLLSLTFSNLL